jgi:hypothetical protein
MFRGTSCCGVVGSMPLAVRQPWTADDDPLSLYVFGKRENTEGIPRKEETMMAGGAGLSEPATEERAAAYGVQALCPVGHTNKSIHSYVKFCA